MSVSKGCVCVQQMVKSQGRREDGGKVYGFFMVAAFWLALLRRAPAPNRAEEIQTLTVMEPFRLAKE